MKKLIYLLMSLSFVAFVACSEDKDNPVNNENTRTENGSKGGDTGSNGDKFGNTSGDSNGNVSAVSVFKSGTENGHDYVDLGLSGTKWATCNVGATNAQDYGDYYAWGEVTTKDAYHWDTYWHGTYGYDNDFSKLTKYISSDEKNTLDLSDDAAYVNWGGKWRMPTNTQWDELINKCYWVWTENYNNSNVKGYIVYKAKSYSDKGQKIYKNETPSSSYTLSDAHIFLPAAGYCQSILYEAGRYGWYWSSSLCTSFPSLAWCACCNSGRVSNNGGSGDRFRGLSVRAVFK